jgi:hypothetical protein
MSVQPILAMCGGGLGAAVLFSPVLIAVGAVMWWMLAWAFACLAGIIGSLVYVRRAP